MLFKWLEKYFGFSRRELTGIGLLGGLLILLAVAVRFHQSVGKDHRDLAVHIDEIEQFLTTAEEQVAFSNGSLPDATPAIHLSEIEYFPFDPNKLAVVDWKRLGLSDRQIRVIKNYEGKGGRFRRKEDLKKIYVIDEADYRRLEPFIRLPISVDRPEGGRAPNSRKPTVADYTTPLRTEPEFSGKKLPDSPIELNTTDSAELQLLPGIGPAYASRIIRFRDRLGGFYDASQLLDVYGFDTTRFEGLKSHVYADTGNVRKIGVDTASYEQLRGHPFIAPKLANAIVQYRKQHGPYRALTDLRKIVLMDEETFRKIAPYLTLSND